MCFEVFLQSSIADASVGINIALPVFEVSMLNQLSSIGIALNNILYRCYSLFVWVYKDGDDKKIIILVIA